MTALPPMGRLPRRRTLLRSGVVALALSGVAVGASACSSTSSTSSATSAPSHESSAPVSQITVTIKNFAFHPASFMVKPGAKITVTNKDSVTHTFTADSGVFNTGDISPGATKTVTAPTKPGTYPYRCLIHQFMTGTLVVKS